MQMVEEEIGEEKQACANIDFIPLSRYDTQTKHFDWIIIDIPKFKYLKDLCNGVDLTLEFLVNS